MNLGEHLRDLRGSLSLTEVGQSAGVDHGTLGQIEKGQRKATPDILRKLADFYEVPYSELCYLHYEQEFSNPNVRESVLFWAQRVLSTGK